MADSNSDATVAQHERSSGRQITLTNIDLVSATKVGAIFAGTVFAVWVIAWLLLWFVLSVAGIWGRMNSLIVDITGFDAISGGLFIGTVFIVGFLEFVVLTVLAPLAAVIYNSAVAFIGGLNITVQDEIKE